MRAATFFKRKSREKVPEKAIKQKIVDKCSNSAYNRGVSV
nr:MAG TPA: hypothetical protein [Caudoviricetes sp.]